MGKKTSQLIFLLILIFFVFESNASETLTVPGDERIWQISGKSELQEVVFLPKDQSVNNWTEALLYHHIPGTTIPLEVYLTNFETELKQRLGGLLETRVIEEDESFILFEWWLDKDVPGAQHGLVQIAKVPNGVDFIRFTTKDIDNIEKIATFWENILKKFRIQPMAKEIKVSLAWDFDGRKWILNPRDPEKNEYILEGETELSPSEYVTIDTYAATTFSPRESFDVLIKQLEKKYGSSFSYRVLFSNQLTGLLEWTAVDNNTPIHEWVFFSKEKPGVSVVVRHHSLTNDAKDKNIQAWEKILSKAKIDVSYGYAFKTKEEMEEREEYFDQKPPWSPFYIREPKGPLFYYK